ncbi:MAG: ABC transporter permease [Lachnospiraceae bacterium]|nr:ABC transporter permease [Lachnospiraceae bacterium]
MLYKIVCLTKRNCLIFLKDKGAVFFSLLSMIIVLILMGVFLGGMNVDSVTTILSEYGINRDAAADKENATHLVQYWTLAGLMVVNALTVTLAVIGSVVTDKLSDKWKSLATSPVNHLTIAISYILAAVMIGFLFCVLTFACYMIYIYISGGQLLSIQAFIKVMGYTLLNVGVFAIIMYFVALWVKSQNAWGGIATVVGTLVGFLGAIYVPVGALPKTVSMVLKYIPILHQTSLMRKIMCEEALVNTFAGMPIEALTVYREEMGIDILMNEKLITDEMQLFLIGTCGMMALVLAVVSSRASRIR